jgi:lauroyl/myristoyl acyltransferase
VAVRDLGYLAYLPAATLVAWLVPESRWDDCCLAAACLRARVRPGWFARRAEAIGGYLGAQDARAVVLGLSANLHRARLQILRSHRPPAWEPRFDLVGGEHIERAAAAGRGVILWLAPFVFDGLLTKMALHRAGFAVAHLSRSGHGFSTTRLGARYLNPLWTSVEDRYLAERLTMTHDGSAHALRALVQRVRRNGIVSVTVGSQSQSTAAMPFLHGRIRVADAVPALAVRTGAALLLLVTIREADGRFVTTVEAPLCPNRDENGDPARRFVEHAAARLEPWVRQYPAQFAAWDDVTAAEHARRA